MFCTLCNRRPSNLTTIKADQSENGMDTYVFECPNCGNYRITPRSISAINALDDKRYTLSAAVRYHSDRNNIYTIDINENDSNIDSIISSFPVPKSLNDKVDLLLQGLELLPHTKLLEREFDINNCCAISGTKSQPEASEIFQLAREREFLKFTLLNKATFTSKGLDRIEYLKMYRAPLNQAFVAMHFTDEMKLMFFEHIKPTLERNGYTVAQTVRPTHNNKIDSELIKEMERSSLMIVDLTDQRLNVCFEAGFATAMKMEIIYSISDAQKANEEVFYIRQTNHITWKDGKDFGSQLSEFLETLHKKQKSA